LRLAGAGLRQAKNVFFADGLSICESMRLKTDEARLFYANDATERHLGVRELRRQIRRNEVDPIVKTKIVYF
jgi:hypothetical protein